MSKKIFIFFVMVSLISAYARALSADLVLLKTRQIISGDIIEETESYVKIKSDSGTGTFKLDEVVGAVRDEEVPTVSSPEEVYKDRLSKIGARDAKAHYDLGIFCLDNGLLKEARGEFNKVVELNPEYKEVVEQQLIKIDRAKAEALYNCGLFFCNFGDPKRGIDYLERLISAYPQSELADKARKLILSVKEKETTPQPLSDKDIKSKFEEGKLPIPFAVEDIEKISLFINGMAKKQKFNYCNEYLKLGKEYQNKASAEGIGFRERRKFDLIALNCYKIARVEESLSALALAESKNVVRHMESQGRTYEEILEGTLPIPSPDKKDGVRVMIKGLGKDTEKEVGAKYVRLGDVFMDKAERATSAQERKEYLKTAVACYEIGINYIQDQLSRAVIEANRKQALKKLNAPP